MPTVNAADSPDVVRPSSSARLSSHVLIAIGVAIACTLLLTVLMTEQQLSMSSMGDQTSRIPIASIFVHGLIFYSPWVVLAPAITLLGWYQRLGTGKLAWRAPVWVVAVVIACVVDPVIMTALARLLGVRSASAAADAPFLSQVQHRFTQNIALNAVMFLVATLLYHALVYYGAYRDRSRREAALEGELARFRLHVLQQQLQPHFLFNALHTVSALMAEDVVTARRVLAQLGDLLRTALDRMDEQDIVLEQELEFLRAYVAIQTARFGDRLTVEWAIDDEARSIPVPNMILQPCLENAIQHGIEPLEGGGSVTVAARVSGASLHIDITDNGQGATGKNGQVGGRGLKNVRDRLEARYGERQTFEAGNVPGGGFRVRIALPR